MQHQRLESRFRVKCVRGMKVEGLTSDQTVTVDTVVIDTLSTKCDITAREKRLETNEDW